jgi:hypothetical protein
LESHEREQNIVPISVKVIEDVIETGVLFHEEVIDLSQVVQTLKRNETNRQSANQHTSEESLGETESIHNMFPLHHDEIGSEDSHNLSEC